jgi:hypothetical protein
VAFPLSYYRFPSLPVNSAVVLLCVVNVMYRAQEVEQRKAVVQRGAEAYTRAEKLRY